jgi:hypothetical protein
MKKPHTACGRDSIQARDLFAEVFLVFDRVDLRFTKGRPSRYLPGGPVGAKGECGGTNQPEFATVWRHQVADVHHQRLSNL